MNLLSLLSGERAAARFVPMSAAVRALDKVWAIEDHYARETLRVLDAADFAAHAEAYKANAKNRLTADFLDYDDAGGSDAPAKPYQVVDGIAVLALTGPMTKQPTSWGEGTSTVMLRRALRAAGADADVRGIMLIVDSPGGQVSGTGDLAADVAKIGQTKPVHAYAEDLCASAALWVASQATVLTANPSGTVGCIGTLMVLEDSSKMYEKAGIKVLTVTNTGAEVYKGSGTDGTNITDKQLAYFKAIADTYNTLFVGAIAAGRKMTPEAVNELADGRVHIGADAVAVGLIDAVGSIDDAMSRLRAALPAETPGAAKPLPAARTSAGASASAETPEEGTNTTASEPSAGEQEHEMTLLEQIRAALGGSNEAVTAAVAAVAETPATAAVTPAVTPAATTATAPTLTAEQAALLAAAEAAGIKSPADLSAKIGLSALGAEHVASVRADAKAQAVRAHGADLGGSLAATVDNVPFTQLVAMRDAWQGVADKTFGIGANGAGADRASAPKVIAESVSAEGTTTAKTAWEQLSAAQQSIITDMRPASNEAREKMAATFLKDKGDLS